MLDKETLELCIKELEESYKSKDKWANRNDITMTLMGKDLYKYEHALYMLKEELKNLEENS